MKKQKIIIVIENGVVSEVFSTRKNSRFEIINRDEVSSLMDRVYSGKEDVDESNLGELLCKAKEQETKLLSGLFHKSKGYDNDFKRRSKA